MDDIKNLYQKIIREEVESAEVQKAREIFLRDHFPHKAPAAAGSPWKVFFSPTLRLALVGCFALLILVKTGTIIQTPQPNVSISPDQVVNQAEKTITKTIGTPSEKAALTNNIQIQKISSQMGAAMAYQKNFPDVQITVVWVLPEVQNYGA